MDKVSTSSSLYATPIVASSFILPPIFSTTITPILPDGYFFLRTNIVKTPFVSPNIRWHEDTKYCLSTSYKIHVFWVTKSGKRRWVEYHLLFFSIGSFIYLIIYKESGLAWNSNWQWFLQTSFWHYAYIFSDNIYLRLLLESGNMPFCNLYYTKRRNIIIFIVKQCKFSRFVRFFCSCFHFM